MEPKERHSIKLETHVTVGPESSSFQIEKKRAAIKAALHAAVSGLAAQTSILAEHALQVAEDGGTPPWGEVIIEPIWEQRSPPDGGGARMRQSAELFWE